MAEPPASPTGRAETIDDDLPALRSTLGQKVRMLRKQRHLSTRALADAAGVTSGFVSQLENGHAMPSVATLLRMAEALEVRVGDLFDTPAARRQIIRRAERRRFDYPQLGVSDELISADPNEHLEVLMGYIDPGGGSGAELYTHGADTEFVLVLAGEIILLLGDERHHLETGDAVTFGGDIPHGYVNEGREVAQLLWVMTPLSY